MLQVEWVSPSAHRHMGIQGGWGACSMKLASNYMDNTNKTQANKKKDSGKVLTVRQKKPKLFPIFHCDGIS